VELLEVAPPLRCYAQAALAEAALRAGRVDEALALARAAAELLESLGEVHEGESFVRLVHAQTLRAAGLAVEADAVLARARVRLAERAAKISDDELRRQFLTVVPENRATYDPSPVSQL
jgi:hypothetical protein